MCTRGCRGWGINRYVGRSSPPEPLSPELRGQGRVRSQDYLRGSELPGRLRGPAHGGWGGSGPRRCGAGSRRRGAAGPWRGAPGAPQARKRRVCLFCCCFCVFFSPFPSKSKVVLRQGRPLGAGGRRKPPDVRPAPPFLSGLRAARLARSRSMSCRRVVVSPSLCGCLTPAASIAVREVRRE